MNGGSPHYIEAGIFFILLGIYTMWSGRVMLLHNAFFHKETKGMPAYIIGGCFFILGAYLILKGL